MTLPAHYVIDPTALLITRLVYSGYAHNRKTHPEIPVEKWALIFDNVDTLEAEYQREKVA